MIFREYLFSFLNKPYIWGGDDPIKGFDCSGLVSEWLQATGVLPHRTRMSAQGINDYLRNETGFELGKYEFGSLSFYGKTQIDHIAIMLNEHVVLDASGGGADIKTEQDAINKNAFVKIRPLNYRKDLIVVMKPKYPFNINL